MLDTFFSYLISCNDFLWGYINFFLIFAVGFLLCISSRFFQIRMLPRMFRQFFALCKEKKVKSDEGLHPISTFFAAIGGSLGISNTVAVCTAVQFGGPGALFWIWVGGILGMLLKYSEVYLGILHRVKNPSGGFNGGPMYYLKKAFRSPWVPAVVASLLCVYSVEVYVFRVMVDSCIETWHINKYIVFAALLVMTLLGATGGFRRVGKISSILIPIALFLYCILSLYVIGSHISIIPRVFQEIFEGAFRMQSAIGGFAGSSLALTISMGMSRACYSSDIGVGYSSVIHAESNTQSPSKQGSLAILAIFLDIFIVCTLSILMVLATSTWQEPIDSFLMIKKAFSSSFPWIVPFMPFFFFLLGSSTLITYFAVGIKCSQHVFPKKGKPLFYLYACLMCLLCCFMDSVHALAIMSMAGALLFVLNVIGIYRLRKEVRFELDEEESKTFSL